MFSGKMHFFIKSLDACHICLRIVGKFYLLSTTHSFCSPVEISHIYRASHLAGDGVETGLPAFYWLAGSFRSKGKVYYRSVFHLVDDAQSHIAAFLSVNRNSAQFSQKPSERTPEKFTLDHTVRLATYRYIIKIRNHEIPE